MAGYNDYASQAISQLININKTMINGSYGTPLNSIFLGGVSLAKFDPTKSPSTPTGNSEKFINTVFTQPAAAAAAAAPAFLDIQTRLAAPSNNIVLIASGTSYTTFTSGSTLNGTTLVPNLRDVNLYSWCSSGSTEFCLILQKLYYIHDLFQLNNWETFTKGGSVILRGFTTAAVVYNSNVKLVTTDTYTLSASEYNVLQTPSSGTPVVYLKDLIDIGHGDAANKIDFNYLKTVKNLNTLIFRRLFYLWIRMAQYRIASTADFSSSIPWTSTISEQVKQCQFYLLTAANNAITSSNFTQTIYNAINQSQTGYRTTAATLNDLTTQINSGKGDLIRNQNAVQNNSKTYKIITIFQYTLLAVLGTVILAAAVVGMGATTTVRSSYSVMILMGTIISAMIVMLVYQRYVPKETFTAGITGAATTQTNDTGFMQNVQIYASNTFTALAYLDSYDIISNFNRAIQQDMNRQYIANSDIGVSAQRLDSISKIVELNKVQANARIYLLIFVTVVIGVLVPVYVWAENAPNIRYIALAIAVGMILMAIVMYGYQVTSLVRTNGEKKYWGQPIAYATST